MSARQSPHETGRATVPTQHATMSNDVLLACTVGDLPWLRQGLSKGIDPCTKNKEGLNGLHLAAKNGRVQCIQHLLDNCDIDVNSLATSSGNTALHFCISLRSGAKTLQCVKLLLDRGADKNKQNMLGQTALHLASKIGHGKCLKTLLEYGADIHITDKDGFTAYNIACLQSQHECARLLRALHWANKKDTSTSQGMREEAMRQSREKEAKVLHARLKKEAAGTAYDKWLEKNNATNSGVHSPTECATRQEIRTQPDRTITCTTCSQVATQHQSASTTRHRPKGVKPMKIALHQEKRNIGSVGKPDKMYPYTNYPPEAIRSHRSSVCPAGKSKLGSSRTSRPTSIITRSSAHVPAGVKYYRKLYKKWQHQTAAKVGSATRETPSNDNQGDIQVESDSQVTQTVERVTPTDEMEEGISSDVQIAEENTHNTNELIFSREQRGEQTISPDLENDDMDVDDDFAFHDVGYANSLNALSLPCSLTKERTPAEVVQLLRSFGSPGPKSYKRSHSYSQATSRYKSMSQRRFSLGSIPEGKIVTSYSDEDASSTQLLNYHDIETLIQNYSRGSNRRRAWEMDDDYNLEEDQAEEATVSESEESLSSPDGSDDVFEFSQRTDFRDCNLQTQQFHATNSDSVLLEKRKQANPAKASPSRRLSTPKSMAFVNLAWDSKSNTVQSQVTVLPMSTLNHRGKHTRIHRPTPPGSRSPSPSESRPRSLSLYEVRALSRSPSPRDPKMTPPQSRELTSPHTPRSSSPSMEYVHPASGIPNPASSYQPSSLLQAASKQARHRISSPLPNPGFSPATSPLFTSPRAKSPVPTVEMEPDQPHPAPPLPSHSLFSVSSFASKSMILSAPETDHGELMLQRVKSAPSVSAHVKCDREISTVVLKPTVFEFGGTVKFS